MFSSNVILVRYGELTLKSYGIRYHYEKILVEQIKYFLKYNEVLYKNIKQEIGRSFIYFETKENTEKAKKILTKVFGIYSISVCISCRSNIEEILLYFYRIGNEYIKDKEAYAVKVKRSSPFPFKSFEIASMCGDAIWKAIQEKGDEPIVDLKNPKKVVYLEIRDQESYIFFDNIKCLGGLPVGTQGKMILLLSGGIDSPVAGWMMMKRGVDIIPLYINNGKYSS